MQIFLHPAAVAHGAPSGPWLAATVTFFSGMSDPTFCGERLRLQPRAMALPQSRCLEPLVGFPGNGYQ